MKPIAAVALMTLGPLGKRFAAQAVRYETFIIRAQTLGLTNEQAKAIVEDAALERRRGTYEEIMDLAARRLDSYCENGYLTVTLREVLTEAELATQPFPGGTILNDWRQVSQPLGRLFADAGREAQRACVREAIALARLSDIDLVKALRAILEQAGTSPLGTR